MSGAAVVIIIGGGTQPNFSADTDEHGNQVVRIELDGEGTVAEQLRRAADTLDGYEVSGSSAEEE